MYGVGKDLFRLLTLIKQIKEYFYFTGFFIISNIISFMYCILHRNALRAALTNAYYYSLILVFCMGGMCIILPCLNVELIINEESTVSF